MSSEFHVVVSHSSISIFGPKGHPLGATGNSKRSLDVGMEASGVPVFELSTIDISWAAVELLEFSTFIFGPKGPLRGPSGSKPNIMPLFPLREKGRLALHALEMFLELPLMQKNR